MSIVMNMSNYTIEHDSNDPGYDDEVMCAGWNPAVALACQQQSFTPADEHLSVPADLAIEDAELFLQRMYACQH